MVVALTIMAILTFVAVDLILTGAKRRWGLVATAATPEDVLGSARSRAARLQALEDASFPKGLRYHAGHTWANTTGGGLVAVGLDELGGKVIGKVDGITLPRVGEEVRQGKAAWTITHAGRAVSLVSPVTGSVVEVNTELESNPELINASPYTQGWVFKSRVSRAQDDLQNLFAGASARKLMDLSRAWLCSRISSSPSYYRLVTCQDGGELVEGIGDSLSEEEWEKLKQELFLDAE